MTYITLNPTINTKRFLSNSIKLFQTLSKLHILYISDTNIQHWF